MPQGAHLGTALVIAEPGEDAIIRKLKRSILLFDNIAVLHLSHLLAFLGAGAGDRQLQAELEWLLERGLLTGVHDRYELALENPFDEATERRPRALNDALEYAGFFSYLQIQRLQLSKWRRKDAVLRSAVRGRLLTRSCNRNGIRLRSRPYWASFLNVSSARRSDAVGTDCRV